MRFPIAAILAIGLVFQSVIGADAVVSEALLQSWKESFRRPEKIPYPADNPYSNAKEELGKKLFFDPRLSGSGTIACATCHNPQLGWSDGLAKGVGEGHRSLSRRTPTLFNLAWGTHFFWDGRAPDLETQALGPIQSAAEMNQSLPDLVDKMNHITGYRELFQRAFPGEPISPKAIGQSLATFERGIRSGQAPFDRWVQGDAQAISATARRGFVLFISKANCAACHFSWNFSDGSFRDIGLSGDDPGMGKFAKDHLLQHTFKTPSLRDVGRRGPFMHDGSLGTLEQVIQYYSEGPKERRESVSPLIQPFSLSDTEKKDLLDFLETLNGDNPTISVPELPR
jgi:cytochrome c peroxidase